MRSPLTDEACTVVSNDQVGPGLHLMRLESPSIARSLAPGQFVHMKVPGMEGHILRRPFSVYRCDPEAGCLEIIYQVVGFGTQHMTGLELGAKAALIGPVGRGWQVPEGARSALLVGGGVGAAPLYMFAQQLCSQGVQVQVVLGAQTKDALVTYDDYCALEGSAVLPATDDGSFGHAGFCTQPAQEALDAAAADGGLDFVACCGPEPLMRIVAGMCRDAHVPCQVSMERRMACGVGACLSCVVETTQGKKRSCVDGPVFDALEVVW